MKSFIPDSIYTLHLVTIIVICTIGVGYLCSKIRSYKIAVICAWLLVVSTTIIVEVITKFDGAGFRMLAIIMVMLMAMKGVVAVEYYKGKNKGLSLLQWLAFIGWFGMRPGIFEDFRSDSLKGSGKLIVFGATRIVGGIIVLYTAHYIAFSYYSYISKVLFSGFCLIGLSLILHFGILNVSAGFWRISGVDTRTLFKSPLLSTSLTEFWGKRWNIAFSEMTAIAVFKPLKTYTGIPAATVIAFIFSGILHELAISVPVKNGYGLPLLYFLIQGILMIAEKGMKSKGIDLDKNKWLGRVWVWVWLAIPLPILFHKTFIKEIIWPVIGVF